MSSVLDRSILEQSPLADLHLLADELAVDGYRRLRKPELLVEAILARQTGAEVPDTEGGGARGRRSRGDARGRRSGGGSRSAPTPRRRRSAPTPRRSRGRSRRGRRGGRGRSRDADRDDDGAPPEAPGAPPRPRPRSPPPRRRTRSPRASWSCWPTGRASCAWRRRKPTDDDVYISAAQVKRCELVVGRPDRRPGARSRGAPSASRRSCGSTPSTAARPTRSPRARASRTCPPRSPASASSSAPRTRRSRRSSG